MAGRASIVGAASTHVGKVRDHNEDAHFFDADAGLFLVCDGMGGHAAGEVASALAVQTIRGKWLDDEVRRVADAWLAEGTAEARKRLFGVLRAGVSAAHDQILAEGARDDAKSGMGTTVVGAILVGNELVFAHAGDSRAYLVRDGIAMQLTEDHTLLARLLAAGIDVDVSGEGARFRSMLTNALGIGQECKVATFVVPLADGDRFLLCSDGISEYVPEAEVGTVLSQQSNPARAAERFVELALARGGGDNATAVVIRVLEAGETPQPAGLRRLDDEAIRRCPLWGPRITPQQRLRALRIAIPRDHAAGERVPAHTLGDRVAWIVLEGALSQDGKELGPGALVYPESLISDSPAPASDALAVARTDVRALALRADDLRELCEDDTELGEALLETLGTLVAGRRRPGRVTRTNDRANTEIETRRGRSRASSNSDVIDPPPPVLAPLPIAARSPSETPAQGPVPQGPVPQGPAPQGPAPRPAPRTVPPHPPPGAPSTPPKGTPAAAAKPSTPPKGTPAAAAKPSTPPRGAAVIPGPPTPAESSGLFDPRSLYEGEDDEDDTIDSGHADVDPATSPRIKRAPSDPEIETYYEMDAEPPPLPEADDDDPIAEMTVLVDDEGGDEDGRVTEKVTETQDATVAMTLRDDDGDGDGGDGGDGDGDGATVTVINVDDDDEEPTRIHAVTPPQALAAVGPAPALAPTPVPVPERPPQPPRRPKRITDGGLEE